MAARTSSGADAALADSPSFDQRLAFWKTALAATDWTPWLIIALGAFLRIFLLAIKPPHFDEGINGWFVDQMTKTGYYKYDPTNYHGPLHFYILFVSQTLFGRNLWALRMPVVLGSIYCLWLTLKFEPFVGRNACRLAALAMAVSPGFVFYGRYSIHEIWLLLFSMLFILGLLGLWKYGSARYLSTAGIGLFGMILTKETYIIHLGCAALAMFVVCVSHWLTPADEVKPAVQTWSWRQLSLIIFLGIASLIFFYSGTFFNFNGVKGLVVTFDTWFQTGQKGNGHEKTWWYWLMLIVRYETAVGIGLLACILCQLFKTITIRYLAIYGVGTLMAYSIVHYKTPWCIISFVWPFLFIFGAAVMLLPENRRRLGYAAAGVVLAVTLGLSVRLNYFRCTTFVESGYDKEKSLSENVIRIFNGEPYVYVQTYNDIWKLTDPLLALARKNPLAYQYVGHLIRTSAYPLPWILGDFARIGYYEKDNLPSPLDADFLLVQEDKISQVEGQLQKAYYTTPLTIRPYQDTSKLYLSAKVFKDFFRGKVPDFTGKGGAP